jgi:hypothetical protein
MLAEFLWETFWKMVTWKTEEVLDLRKPSFRDGRCLKFTQDCVQWQSLVLEVLNVWILLSGFLFS